MRLLFGFAVYVLFSCASLHAQTSQIVRNVFDIKQIPESFYGSDLRAIKVKIDQDKCEDVVSALSKMQKTKKSDLQMRIKLISGLCLQKLSKDKEAVSEFKNYLSLRPASSDVIYFLALSQANQGENDTALANFEESLWFSKFSIVKKEDAFLQNALLLSRMDKKPLALENIKKALAINPAYAPALIESARLNLANNQKADAIKTLHALDPNNSEGRLLLAEALLNKPDRANQQKEISEARDIAKSIYQNDSLSPQVNKAAGVLYVKSLIELAEVEEAEKNLLKLIKKSPTDLELQQLREQLKIEIRSKKAQETPTPEVAQQ